MDPKSIQILKIAIADRLKDQHGDIEVWRHRDYEEVSKLIFEKTKSNLSASTLKRILGNAENNFTPTKSTLNVLSQFLDYKNWDEFINEFANSTEEKSSPAKTSYHIKRPILYAGSFLILIAVAVLIWYKTAAQPPIDINLTTDTPIIEAPGVIAYNFDLSQLENDSVFIDFGKELNSHIDFLSKNSKRYVRNYFIPGRHKTYIFTKKEF